MKRCLIAFFLLAALVSCQQADLIPGQGFLDVPGGPVWYRVVGSGTGIPILLLHGGPGGTSCGFSLLDTLGVERPVVRYDQLGSGRSGRPDNMELWQRQRFVEELHSVRQQLGLTRMHLLGSSWGSALAVQYLLEKGLGGVVSLTLSGPFLSTAKWIEDANVLRGELPEEVQETLRLHENAGTTDSDEYLAATEVFYRRFMYHGERPRIPACEGSAFNGVVYEYMWGPTEFHATGTLLDFDVTDRLAELDLPVLFITGEFDEARPATVAEYQKLVPGSRFEVIKDAGHASLAGKPERYRQILRDFLRDVEASVSQ